MDNGLDLLLARMDSNPQEFFHRDDEYQRWDWFTMPMLRRVEGIQMEIRVAETEEMGTPQTIGRPPPWIRNSTVNYRRRSQTDLPTLSDEQILVVYEKWLSLQNDALLDRVMQTILHSGDGEDGAPEPQDVAHPSWL